MKLLLGSILAAAVAVFLFSFSQANADCGPNDNYTDACAAADDAAKSDNNAGVVVDDGYINDGQDDVGSQDDNKQSSDNNNDDKFDSCPDVNTCNNGGPLESHHEICPDDVCSQDNNKKSNDNHKSSDDNNHQSRHHTGDGVHHGSEKFKVHVNLIYLNAVGGKHEWRVIVYGPHTLNKPTLDKSGYKVNLEACDDDHCRFDLGTVSFTSWKVPKGSSFKACVWKDSSDKSCSWGKATSRSVDVTVTARD
jgi:type II secretory pathway pseudopilin PulG